MKWENVNEDNVVITAVKNPTQAAKLAVKFPDKSLAICKAVPDQTIAIAEALLENGDFMEVVRIAGHTENKNDLLDMLAAKGHDYLVEKSSTFVEKASELIANLKIKTGEKYGEYRKKLPKEIINLAISGKVKLEKLFEESKSDPVMKLAMMDPSKVIELAKLYPNKAVKLAENFPYRAAEIAQAVPNKAVQIANAVPNMLDDIIKTVPEQFTDFKLDDE